MSFPRYPAYKDSGVDWLGEVPEHWEFKKLKNMAFFAGGGTPSRENLDFWGGPIPWVSPKDMKAEKITQAEEGITQEGLDGSTSSLIAPGHVLIVVRSGILKHTIPVAINAVEVALNQDMKAIRLNDEICSSWFFLRWVQGFNDQLLLEWGKQGATVESIEQEYLSQSLIPLPPLNEQNAIAIFLDIETAKIDALIAEQQRLIELLQEKRQAVISHAVTKGLNPDAPMLDSGVEWLGEVPAHWKTLKISKVTDKITNGYVGPTRDILVENGVPYIQATHIKKGRINFDGGYYVRPEWSAAHSKSVLEEGDVLVVQTGAGTGDVGLVSSEDEGFNCHALIILAPKKSVISGQFLSTALLSDCGQQKLESIQTGGMHPHLNCGNIKYVDIPVPPVDEQEAIIEFIAIRTESFESLASDAMVAIGLLQERRSALISDAVTGQIDVRGLVPEASAA
jgi:type I restriction enzyme S subunit